MSDRYDIIVVGAGPGGSMAAKKAAEEEAEVLLIDKRRELGVPVQCAEALSIDILEELEIEPDPRWAVNKIDSTKLISPSGKSLEISQGSVGKVGYILDRKVFDRQLAIDAVRAGANIRVGTFVDGLVEENGSITGVTCKYRGERDEFYSDVIIAADGVMSRVAHWAGLEANLGPEDIESGAQFKMVNVEIGTKSTMEFYFGRKIAPGGYVWIFPLASDMANVGIGVLPKYAKKPAIEYLEDFIMARPGLEDGKILEINAGGVPVSGPIEKTVIENVLVVGDAARQVNSMTGGGIDWSMRAGNIAGRVAAEAIEEGNVSEKALMNYDREWREEMGKKLERYYRGKEVLVSLSDEELDEAAESLQGVDFDEISLTDMLKVLMKTNPKLMLKLRSFI